MANLVSEIMKMATPAIIDKIAASFGLSGDAVRSILTGAVPGLMGAVVSKASSSSGITDILSALRKADPTLGSGMNSALSGTNASSIASQGTSMLSSLLGSGTMSTLSNAVLGSSGVSSAAGTSVLGLAGQMVMGTLAKHSAGLDASGLGSLLTSQAGFINQAMPVGMGNMMGNASSAAAAAASRVKSTVTPPAMPAATGGMGWLKYAIPVALIAIGVWYFMGNRGHEAMEANNATPAVVKPAETVTTPVVTPAATGIMIDNVDVTKNLSGAFADLTGSLGGITDAASATAALPKLQGASTAISAVSAVAAKFTPEQKATVASLVNASMPAISTAATKVEAMPGVGESLKPVLDALLPMLTNLTK
jgi:Bacterial protein of unknown function (DUF937)